MKGGGEIGNLADRAAEKSFRMISSKTARYGGEKLQKSDHIVKRESRKKKPKKRTREEEDRVFDSTLDKMAKQGESLVAVAERMEEHARKQTESLQQLTHIMNLFLSAGRTQDQSR